MLVPQRTETHKQIPFPEKTPGRESMLTHPTRHILVVLLEAGCVTCSKQATYQILFHVTPPSFMSRRVISDSGSAVLPNRRPNGTAGL